MANLTNRLIRLNRLIRPIKIKKVPPLGDQACGTLIVMTAPRSLLGQGMVEGRNYFFEALASFLRMKK